MIYFAQSASSGLIKIGYTADRARRLREIQSMNGEPLALLGWLPGDRKRETAMHRKFAHLRRRGEWFEPGADLMEFIHLACTAVVRPRDDQPKPRRTRRDADSPGSYGGPASSSGQVPGPVEGRGETFHLDPPDPAFEWAAANPEATAETRAAEEAAFLDALARLLIGIAKRDLAAEKAGATPADAERE